MWLLTDCYTLGSCTDPIPIAIAFAILYQDLCHPADLHQCFLPAPGKWPWVALYAEKWKKKNKKKNKAAYRSNMMAKCPLAPCSWVKWCWLCTVKKGRGAKSRVLTFSQLKAKSPAQLMCEFCLCGHGNTATAITSGMGTTSNTCWMNVVSHRLSAILCQAFHFSFCLLVYCKLDDEK